MFCRVRIDYLYVFISVLGVVGVDFVITQLTHFIWSFNNCTLELECLEGVRTPHIECVIYMCNRKL